MSEQQPEPSALPDGVRESEHRPPAPTPTEHNAQVEQARTNGTLPRSW